MNLAISSLIIFLLVGPAIIARRIYYTKELSKNFLSWNTLQEIFSAIFLSIPLHACWIYFAKKYDFPPIDYQLLLKILADAKSITKDEYESINTFSHFIFLYYVSLCFASGCIAYIWRNIVRLGLDRRLKYFEFDNKWSYFFYGEALDIKRYNKNPLYKKSFIISRSVDVQVKSENQMIYSGVLIDFQLNNNSVDYIVLENVTKTSIKNKEEGGIKSSSSVTEIITPNNYLVIPYCEIMNINIWYTYDKGKQDTLQAKLEASAKRKADKKEAAKKKKEEKEERKRLKQEKKNISQIMWIETLNKVLQIKIF